MSDEREMNIMQLHRAIIDEIKEKYSIMEVKSMLVHKYGKYKFAHLNIHELRDFLKFLRTKIEE